MSWSHEDREKPRLNDAVIATLKQAKAAKQAKEEDQATSRRSAVTSKDWMPFYEHDVLPIDVAYEQVFQENDFDFTQMNPAACVSEASAATEVVPETYLSEFNSVFSSKPPATPETVSSDHPDLAEDASVEAPSLVESLPVPDAPKKKKRRRRAARKPEKPTYVDSVTDIDVLMGRGGKSNHHPGNKRYRDEVLNLQSWYKSSAKTEKTDLSQHLVDYIHSYGARFLKKDATNGKWFIVSNLVARKKASQALREHMTPEERAQAKVEESNNGP